MRIDFAKGTGADAFADYARDLLNQMAVTIRLKTAAAYANDFVLVQQNAKEVAVLVEVRQVLLRIRAQLAIGGLTRAQDLIDFRGHRRECRLRDFVEQLLLIAVVQIDGTLRDADFLRDAFHRHALQPFTADEADDRLLNALPFEVFPEGSRRTHDRSVILRT